MQRRIYSDAFAKWPQQALRPDYQIQDVLAKVVETRYKTNLTPAMEQEELLKARALQFLAQNKYGERVRAATAMRMCNEALTRDYSTS